jgi:hypothetical protein
MSELAISTSHLPAASPGPSVATMIQMAIEKGITPDGLEKLCNLKILMDGEQAKRDFSAAFAALQAEMPRVIAMKAVNNKPEKGGGVRYTFAPYEDIMDAVGPFLKKYGFGVSFTTGDAAAGRICSICILSHISGHSRQNQFSVRVGSGPQGTSEAQADGSAKTYAKRGALCDALNIIVSADDDARLEGAYISGMEAEDMRRRVRSSGFNEAKFLKLAGAETFEKIRTGKMGVLYNFIEAREDAKQGSPDPKPTESTPPAQTAPTGPTEDIGPEEAADLQLRDTFDQGEAFYQKAMADLARTKIPTMTTKIIAQACAAMKKASGTFGFTEFKSAWAACADGRVNRLTGRFE